MPQRVQEHNLHAFQHPHGFLWHRAEIRQIGKIANAVADNLGFAVDHRHRNHLQIQQWEWSEDLVQFHLRKAAVLVVVVEDVLEDRTYHVGRLSPGVERQTPAAGHAGIGQRPQIVESQNVVGMAVGVQHGVQPRDPLPYGLFAEVRSAVDEDAMAVPFDHHRRPGAAVVRVGGVADRAAASDRGHAHRCPAAQHGHRSRLHLRAGPGAPGAFFIAWRSIMFTISM